MTSCVDWNRLYVNVQSKDAEESSIRKLYPHIINAIESLAILQKSLLEQQLSVSIVQWMRNANIEDTEKTCKELSFLVCEPDSTFKKLNYKSRQRLTHMVLSLEHILFHELRKAETLIHANVFALKELNDRIHQFPEDTYLKSQFVSFENKIKRWDDLSSLIPILTESVHKVGCSYESKFSSYVSEESSNNSKQPEQFGVTDQGNEIMICDYCQSSVEKNRFGQREELLVCKDCGNKAHPSCLSYSAELVQQIRADDSWQCIDCKACVICDGTGDPDTLLFCDACDKGYHMQCHTPKLEQMPSGKWACSSCVDKGKSVVTPTSVLAVAHVPSQKVFVIDEEPPQSPLLSQPQQPLHKNMMNELHKNGGGERMIVHHMPTHPPNRSPVAKPMEQIGKTKSSPILKPPVMSIPPPGMLYPQPPPGMTFSQLPVGTSPVSLQGPPGHPIPLQLTTNQPHLIPVNYVLPNGVPPQATPPPQTILGKGSHNDLNHILNPKTPLPDVRSSIREDVLRSLPPDVADWTVQDVCYYFKSHGYILESKLLEEQEIDGRALLLMSRNDCLTGLRIKLGPALKIYHMHIHKLQKRTDFLG